MPIDIDPVTGNVVVTPASEMPNPVVEEKTKTEGETTSTGSGFEVPTNKPTSVPSDAIPSPPTKEPLTGMDHRIEEAKKFNAKLSSPVESVAQKEQDQTINKDEELRIILKRNGMDSQQQIRAFAEIKALFG